MGILLYIPWFKAEPWKIPLGFELPLFGIDHIPIQPFGLLVAIGVLLGARLAEVYAKRNGLHPGVVADLVTHVVVAGFVGAYILNGLFYHPDTLLMVLRDPSLLVTHWLGLSSYGGFIGAMIGLGIWRLRRGLPIFPFADATVFALPFGWLFGRSGCFIVHDHPGRITDFPLAVADYRFGEPPFEPRHDLGFYEVLWSIACVTLLLVLWRRNRKAGFYVALVPLLYAPIRFFLDFLRAPAEQGGDARYLGLTPAQHASIALIALGAYLMWRVYRQPAPKVPAYAQWPPSEGSSETTREAAGTPSASSNASAAGRPAGKKGSGGKRRKR